MAEHLGDEMPRAREMNRMVLGLNHLADEGRPEEGSSDSDEAEDRQRSGKPGNRTTAKRPGRIKVADLAHEERHQAIERNEHEAHPREAREIAFRKEKRNTDRRGEKNHRTAQPEGTRIAWTSWMGHTERTRS